MSQSKTILITGANRGIGLGLTKNFLDAGFEVVATARDLSRSLELVDLKEKNADTLHLIELDVSSKESVAALQTNFPLDRLDILLNNAGVLHDAGVDFKSLDIENLEKTFQVNTYGPMRVTQAMLPLLAKSAVETPKVVHITSRMGSIADNDSGQYYSYRMSKSALNMFHKSFSQDFPNICSLVLHPGWVQTDMGGDGAAISVDESVAGLSKIINEASIEQSGSFYNYKGDVLPW